MAVKYLVPDGEHLPVTGEDGKPDHRLMGAAWAALHGGYRGNKYEGPNKSEAISKLKAMYKSEGMDVPNAVLPESQIFANVTAIDEKGRVQLAPYGDFLNVDNKGNRVIQRFEKSDAENIVNDFNRLAKLPTRLLGLPWYIGHPDHPRFRNMHTDSRAYMRVKGLEAADDGLYGNVHFGSAGKALLDEEAFHGHSVNWRCIPAGRDRGLPVFRPVALKSVGFTNDPVIPVMPASLANEDLSQFANDDESESIDTPAEERTEGMIIPPKLKVLAGFKPDDDVTMDQIIEALSKARPPLPNPQKAQKDMANEKKVDLQIGDQKLSIVLANEEENGDALQNAINKVTENANTLATELANVRKAHAGTVVDQLVREGKIVKADRDAKVEELANSKDFEATATEWGKLKPVIKTQATTRDLAGKHAVLNADAQTRQSKFQRLMEKREKEFPNESYQARFDAVADSDEGQQLFAQMQRPETAETR